ncbi:MAG: right-handed parallel beta-helix repeat-containing protein, partial [Planctomycetota bacterium]
MSAGTFTTFAATACCAAALVLFVAPGARAAEYHVSPGGSDAGTGSARRPFKTLEAARDAVRRSPDRGKRPVTVVLGHGRHFRARTFELTPRDSGTEAAPVVYRAAPGAEVIIDGGIEVPLAACRPVSDRAVRGRLAADARAKVREIDLAPFGITEFGEFGPRGFSRPVIPAPNELFVNGQPLRIARWPNDKRLKLGKVIDSGSVPRTGDKSNRGAIFKYDTPRAARWMSARDMYVSGIFGQSWADDAIRVAKLDTKAGTIKTTIPHLYGFRNRNFTTWCVVNLLEEIDLPGEYFVDREARKIYFYPPEGEMRKLQLSVLAGPLVAVKGASHVRVEGLVFENSRGAGVKIEGGAGVVVAGCTLRNLGGIGVSASGGTGHVVRSSDVYNTGAGGVSVSGGDRRTLTPAGHVVDNCDIHH